MASFRTKVLFRFSKDFESLKKVLKNGIYPNYCEEDLSFDNTQFVIGIPMICFCDIPITLLDEQTTRYGLYGIGLSKEWGINHEVSPVMYIANDDIIKSMCYHIQRESDFRKNVSSDEFKQDLIKALIQGNQIEIIMEQIKAEVEHSVNTKIVGYFKKYEGEYKNRNIINYLENEWRYIVPDENGTKWMWTKEEYLQWRFPNGMPDNEQEKTPPKPSPTETLKRHALTFTPEDISYILVKDAEFCKRTIEFIQKTKTIGGSELSEESRVSLITKIITMEQVKEDF